MKKNKAIGVLGVFLTFFCVNVVYAKGAVPDDLNKEWYCNIVKGNALNNYFNFPTVEEGLEINREDYDTSADYADAVDYYSLESYRITLKFLSDKKAKLGWTGLLYDNDYEDFQEVEKTFSYSFLNNQGTFTDNKLSYQFSYDQGVLSFPTENVVCYSDMLEAQKHYNLYELNENFDKSLADDEGFVVKDGQLSKYIGINRKIILPETAKEIVDFDATNIYYFSSFVIPSNVKKINKASLQYLQTDDLVFEEGVEQIDDEALAHANYTDIYLPSSIKVLGNNIFDDGIEGATFHVVKDSAVDIYLKNNYSGEDFELEYDYETFEDIVKECQDYVLYTPNQREEFVDKDGFAIKNDILYAYKKSKSKVVIPLNVKVIADNAFSEIYESEIDEVIVPGTVKKIEYDSFAFTSANTIIFGEGLEKIESFAFSDAYIRDIYLPPSIKTIGRNIFSTEEGLNGTVFHIEKDSKIDQYLQKNPPLGEFEIEYDYSNAEEIINTSRIVKKISIIVAIAVIALVIAIFLLLNNYRQKQKQKKVDELNSKRHESRLKNMISQDASLNQESVNTNEANLNDEVIVNNNVTDSHVNLDNSEIIGNDDSVGTIEGIPNEDNVDNNQNIDVISNQKSEIEVNDISDYSEESKVISDNTSNYNEVDNSSNVNDYSEENKSFDFNNYSESAESNLESNNTLVNSNIAIDPVYNPNINTSDDSISYLDSEPVEFQLNEELINEEKNKENLDEETKQIDNSNYDITNDNQISEINNMNESNNSLKNEELQDNELI